LAPPTNLRIYPIVVGPFFPKYSKKYLAVATKITIVEIIMALFEKPVGQLQFTSIGVGVLLFAKNHPN